MGRSLNELARDINENAVLHGFWDEVRNYGETLALIHSEISEALEEHRAGKPAAYVPVHQEGCQHSEGEAQPSLECMKYCKLEGHVVELADALIRILDLVHVEAKYEGVDFEMLVERKMIYNANRPYKHGKRY